LTLMAPLLHLGMVLVGVPYSVQELFIPSPKENRRVQQGSVEDVAR
jgi:hypothetical protein